MMDLDSYQNWLKWGNVWVPVYAPWGGSCPCTATFTVKQQAPWSFAGNQLYRAGGLGKVYPANTPLFGFPGANPLQSFSIMEATATL
jgi:hypothetical protein